MEKEDEEKAKKKAAAKKKEGEDDIGSIFAESAKNLGEGVKAYNEWKAGRSAAKAAELKAQVDRLEKEVKAGAQITELTAKRNELLLETAKLNLLPVGGSKVYPPLGFKGLVMTARQQGVEVTESLSKNLTLFHYNDRKGERWYKAVPISLFRWKVTGITKEDYDTLRKAIEAGTR